MIEVRPARTPAEIAEVWRSLLRTGRLSLGRAMDRAERDALKARLASAVNDPGQRVRLAAFEGAPAGCYWLEGRPNVGATFLLHIEVRARFRGRGVADDLWRSLCTEAAAMGLPEIRLAVAETNARAVGFYLRHGLAVAETEVREARRWLELRGPATGARRSAAPTRPRSGPPSWRGP